MRLRQRLRRLFGLLPPKAQFMCIRCDEYKPDVRHAMGRCAECERIVLEIALDHPDVYRTYLEQVRRFKRNFE